MKLASRILLGASLAAVAAAFEGTAQAAPPAAGASASTEAADGSSPAIAEAARARFAEGVRLYGKKRYDKALAAFLQAYALTKNPSVLFNLGLTSFKMGNPLQATRYFVRFLEEAKEATAEQKARAQKGIAEARRSLGALEVTAPEGSEVAVDGVPVGRAPLAAPIDVLPGRHDVTSTTATSGTRTQAAQVAAGATVKVRLSSQRDPEAPNAVLEPNPRTPGGSGDASPGGNAPGSGATRSGDETSGGFFAPPSTTWPVYAAGAVGLVSLTAAIVLSGIGANADRNVTNASDALSRNGKSPASCADPASAGDPTIANTCSALRSGQGTSSDVKGPFVATLAVGVGATAFALGWYFFAPKERGEHGPAEGAATARESLRFTPLMGPRGEPGASLDLRF